jgi:iron complex transport system ATP-binding protein
MTALTVNGLVCGYGQKMILQGVSFEVKIGEFVGIVGANGCGKTTLLRALSGLIGYKAGEINIYGKNISDLKRLDIAREVAFVPQLMEPAEGLTVFDMVILGRTPYLERFDFYNQDDNDIAQWAIDEVGIEDIAGKKLSELSGGEFQRAAIARALAQEPHLMLLDEPISHLDIRYQIKILKLLRQLRYQRTIISTFHDLNMAARFCQKLMLMKKGEIVAYGRPDEVITKENIWKAYRVKAEVKKNLKTKHARLVLLP